MSDFSQDFEVISKYETASGKHVEKRIKNYSGKAHGKDYGFQVGKFYRIHYKNDLNGCATIFEKFEEIESF